MNVLTLAQEIIDGKRLTREDDLSFFLTCDLDDLCKGADQIREARKKRSWSCASSMSPKAWIAFPL